MPTNSPPLCSQPDWPDSRILVLAGGGRVVVVQMINSLNNMDYKERLEELALGDYESLRARMDLWPHPATVPISGEAVNGHQGTAKITRPQNLVCNAEELLPQPWVISSTTNTGCWLTLRCNLKLALKWKCVCVS